MLSRETSIYAGYLTLIFIHMTKLKPIW